MEVAMSKCSKESEVARKETEVDWFDFLPDDILSDKILKRLPDAFLREKAKYVCRRWFSLISDRIFVDPHASFILHTSGAMRTGGGYRHVDIREEGQGLQVNEQQIARVDYMGSMIKSWCNDLFLIMNPSKNYILSVSNRSITTDQRLSFLPNCPAASCRKDYRSGRCQVALFFDKFMGVYKVVHLFMGPPIQCHIFILERDFHVSRVITSKWKEIQVPHPNSDHDMDSRVDGDAVQVQGRYFHWDISSSSDYLVSVDAVKEECFLTSGLPKRCSGSRRFFCSTLETDHGFLTLIDGDGVSRGKADIWILKDLKMMRWDKLQSITLSDHYVGKYHGASFLDPVCGVIRKNIIIFKSLHDRSMFAYDLKDGFVKELNIQLEDKDCCVVRSLTPGLM